MSYGYYKGFKQQKWPSDSLNVIGNHAIRSAMIFLYLCNYVSILRSIRDLMAYFPKFKDVVM